MKNNALKKLFGVVFIAGIAVIAVGCSQTKSSSKEVKTITVGTGAMPRPFTYVNSKNKIVGFDIDTLREIDKLLPNYKFKYTKAEFAAIPEALDSGRFQIGANNYHANPQRKAKYYFSKPIFKDKYVLVVRKNNKSITKFADISGKTTVSMPGVNFTTALENFNHKQKDSANKTKITYSNEDAAKTLQDVQAGKYEYVLIDKPLFVNYQKTYNLKGIKAVNVSKKDSDVISDASPYSYYMISKSADGKKLVKDINRALTKIQSNGTAKKISQKYFFGNYIP